MLAKHDAFLNGASVWDVLIFIAGVAVFIFLVGKMADGLRGWRRRHRPYL